MGASDAAGALVNPRIEDLSQNARKAFEVLVAGVDPDDVLGFALFSDVDGADVTVAVNNRATQATNLAKYSFPEYQNGLDSFDWNLYLKWAPGEWTTTSIKHPSVHSAALSRVWAEVGEYQNDVSADDAEFWPSIQYEAGVISLGYMIEDQWFEAFPNAVRIFAVMDGNQDAQTIYRWLASLNPERADEVRAYVEQEFS